jgi:hypothetical protein
MHGPESATLAPPVAESTLPELIRDKLSRSDRPLKLADVVKGLPRPKKVKPADFQTNARDALDEDYRLGRVFRYHSGPKGVERFWVRDEKQILRGAILDAASQPKTQSTIRTAVGKTVKGTDGKFIDDVIRGLIAEDRLFECPPKSKAGGPLFATHAPPPPLPKLETAKFQKKLETVVKSAAKLLADAGVPTEELLDALRLRLTRLATTTTALPATAENTPAAAVPELDELILKAVAHQSIGQSIADLRREMPAEFRGPAFDAAVIRLAEQGKVQLFQDADPLEYREDQRVEFVSDSAGHFFTGIGKGVGP